MISGMGLKGVAEDGSGESDAGVHRQPTLLPGLMHFFAPVRSWMPPQAAWVRNYFCFHELRVYLRTVGGHTVRL